MNSRRSLLPVRAFFLLTLLPLLAPTALVHLVDKKFTIRSNSCCGCARSPGSRLQGARRGDVPASILHRTGAGDWASGAAAPVLEKREPGETAARLAGLQRRYEAVDSISARFTQVYRAPGVEQVESGVLYLKKPGLMRWEYREPETKLFIADGRNTYLYTPADRQVLIRPFSSAELRSTPLQFLLGQGNILDSFTPTWEKEFKPSSEGTFLIRLVPRFRQPDYAFVVVECDEKTFELRRLVIRELAGNTSEFLLTNLALDVKIEKKQFQFKIPKGVEVVHLDDKN